MEKSDPLKGGWDMLHLIPACPVSSAGRSWGPRSFFSKVDIELIRYNQNESFGSSGGACAVVALGANGLVGVWMGH